MNRLRITGSELELLRFTINAILVSLVFFSGMVEAAYDLPKIKIEKNIEKENPAKNTSIGSDWSEFEEFETKMKLLSLRGERLSPSDPKRIFNDKNHVFVAFFNGNAYFLDRYSLKIIKNSKKECSWEQHIFPIGKNISPQNSKATIQTFFFDGENIYNSSRRKNNLDELENSAGRNFLEECFEVGYCYAFKKTYGKE